MPKFYRLTGRVLLFSVVIFSLVASSFAAIPAQAGTANKSVVGGGTYSPGDEPTISIDFSKGDGSTFVAEVVFVIDASPSVGAKIEAAKTQISSFLDNLTYGSTKVGIVTFGYRSSKSIDFNDPYVTTVKPLTLINDSASKNSVKNSLNAITSNINVPEFSDLYGGIVQGNSLFSGTANILKYMVLYSDGGDSYPANGTKFHTNSGPSGQVDAGQEGYLFDWNGKCIVTSSNGSQFAASGVTSKYTKFYVVKNDGAGLTAPLDKSYYEYNPATFKSDLVVPCNAQANLNKTGNDIMSLTASAYPNASLSTTLTPVLDDISDSLDVDTISLNDNLTGNIFSQATTYKGVYNCDDSPQKIQSDQYVVSVNNVQVTIKPANVDKATKFCVRFQAQIKPSAASGSQPINTSGSSNRINYYNSSGVLLYYDDIEVGTINISTPPATGTNLIPGSFNLADVDGNDRQAFEKNEDIYVDGEVKNILSDDSESGSVTRYYYNEPSALNAGSTNALNPPYKLCTTHGPFGGNRTYEYASYPGGSKVTSFDNCPASGTGAESWKVGSDQQYTARMYVNYVRESVAEPGRITETVYTDNQATRQYTVYTPPTVLAPNNISCSSANLRWTPSASPYVVGYKVKLKNVPKVTWVTKDAGNASSYNWTGLNPHPSSKEYEWYLIPQVDINPNSGVTAVDGKPIKGPNFTLTDCPRFHVDGTSTDASIYNNQDTSSSATVTFDSASGTWGTNKVHAVIAAIKTSSTNCSDITPGSTTPAASMTAGGVTFGLGTWGTNFYDASYTSTPFPITVAAHAGSGAVVGQQFTLCITSSSTASPDVDRDEVHFIVKNSNGWLQIAGQSASSANAGDVHSNGTLNINIPPSQYFFMGNKTGGVVSASKSAIPSTIAATWKWSTYAPPNKTDPMIATDNYSSLQTAADKKGLTPLTDASLILSANVCRGQTGGATVLYKKTGNVNISDGPITFNCNANLVFFVDGDLTVNNNVTDTSNNAGTLTFVVSGNINVGTAITTMDGVYIFGKQLSDPGNGATSLTVHGSLIGLSGNSDASFKLDRSVTNNNTTPAEIIYYQPKYTYILRDALSSGSTYSWTE